MTAARRGKPLTILVSGMIAGVPGQGGAAWAVLQYVLGLAALGHNVHFVEPIDPAAEKPEGVPLERTRNAHYLRAVERRFRALRGRTTLVVARGTQTAGLSYDRLSSLSRRSDVLINISGLLRHDELTARIPLRVYVDLDPAFTQLWQAQGIDMGLGGHTHHVTVGLSIGAPESRIPTHGLQWITTLPPVVLSEWRPARRVAYDCLTTVANWRGYGSIEHEGISYGQKAHSLRRLISLPRLVDEQLLLALAIHPDERPDLVALQRNGWQLIDPVEAAGTPARYRRFVRGSTAEFGLAKDGYVKADVGWFSDRSACYLASGRPVLAQETGFTRHLPTGEGLLAFSTLEQAADGVARLRRDYRRHARAARAIAEELLDSSKVLGRMLTGIGATA